MSDTRPAPAWFPNPKSAENSNMAVFRCWLADEEGRHFDDCQALREWSVEDPGAFWGAVAAWGRVDFASPCRAFLEHARMPGAVWFPGATLDYTAHVMSHALPGRCAIRHEAEDGTLTEVDWWEPRQRTAAFASALRELGVGRGDPVVGYLPNTPDTVVAFLATASLGAIWSLLRAGHGRGHGARALPADRAQGGDHHDLGLQLRRSLARPHR